MDRLQTLEMFVAVADRGGFAAAARALRVSPPAVTRGIAELEARLGVVMFHRSTRAVTLTDEGAGFLERARQIISDLGDAERALSGAQSEPRGQLYVTAPVTFGRLHVLPVVAELLDRNVDLKIRMMLIDRNVRIVEEGIDAAVRIGALTDSALRAVRIGSVRQVIVASPAYLARFGIPRDQDHLGHHRLIGSEGPRATSEWHFGARKVPEQRPRLRVNTVDAAISAAESGVGLANFLSYQVEDALDAGRLIEVLKPETPEAIPVSLLFEASRSNAPATRAFVEAMRLRARESGWGRPLA